MRKGVGGGNLIKFLFHQIKNKLEIIKLETGRIFQNTVIFHAACGMLSVEDPSSTNGSTPL